MNHSQTAPYLFIPLKLTSVFRSKLTSHYAGKM